MFQDNEAQDNEAQDNEELDESWVNEYKLEEHNYNAFYKEIPLSIKVFFLYIGSDKNITSLKEDMVLLDENGILEKNILVDVIKNNEKNNNLSYRLSHLLKYNFNINPEEVINYINNTDNSTDNYLTPLKNLNSIKFVETVCIFNDINALFMIFQEKETHTNKSTTRKIILKNTIHKTRHKRIILS